MAEIQEARVSQKPVPVVDDIPGLVSAFWGLEIGQVKALDSYDDANFFITVKDGESDKHYLLKFYNAIETDNVDFLDGLSVMLNRLSDRNAPMFPIQVPTIVAPIQGGAEGGKDFIFTLSPTISSPPVKVAVRLFHWIAGDTLNQHAATVPWTTFVEVGQVLGRMQWALFGVDHPSLHRYHLWDLRNTTQPLTAFAQHLAPHPWLQQTIVAVQHVYEAKREAWDKDLPRSIIMGDANDANLIVRSNAVSGVIDFSDVVHTWRVNEIAIALAYALVTAWSLHNPSTGAAAQPLPVWDILGAVFMGYLSATPASMSLTTEEIEAIPVLMAARLAVSVSVGAYSIAQQPHNTYLALHAQPARRALWQWCTGRSITAEPNTSASSSSSAETTTVHHVEQCLAAYAIRLRALAEQMRVLARANRFSESLTDIDPAILRSRLTEVLGDATDSSSGTGR